MRRQQEEAKIVVVSEDDQTRQLLETRISKDDGYQKQQGMLLRPHRHLSR
jgi:protein phosphatase-4 regulatory subunit 3